VHPEGTVPHDSTSSKSTKVSVKFPFFLFQNLRNIIFSSESAKPHPQIYAPVLIMACFQVPDSECAKIHFKIFFSICAYVSLKLNFFIKMETNLC
jgi:hypothetical protein